MLTKSKSWLQSSLRAYKFIRIVLCPQAFGSSDGRPRIHCCLLIRLADVRRQHPGRIPRRNRQRPYPNALPTLGPTPQLQRLISELLIFASTSLEIFIPQTTISHDQSLIHNPTHLGVRYSQSPASSTQIHTHSPHPHGSRSTVHVTQLLLGSGRQIRARRCQLPRRNHRQLIPMHLASHPLFLFLLSTSQLPSRSAFSSAFLHVKSIRHSASNP